MAATANSNPCSSAASTLSPGSKTGSPPWTQIVRGPDSDSAGGPKSPPELTDRNYSDNSDNGGNAGGGKKPVWNKKPSNGPVENGGPGPAVMGPSEAWPALSESTKASPKLSSSDSSKSLPDFGSVSSPKEIGTESSPLSIAPPVQSPSQASSTSQKPTTNNMNHSSMPNHGRPTRQKSMKRDGGGNPQANGGFSHQILSGAEGSHNHNYNHSHITSKPSSAGPAGGSDSSVRDSTQNHSHRELGSRNASGDHPQPRNYRRGSGGSHSRGDGSHQNYGGRRGGDRDRGNFDWNHSRSFNGREATVQLIHSPRNLVRAPPVSAAFMPPAMATPMPIGHYPPPYFHPMAEVPFVIPHAPFPHHLAPHASVPPAADPELRAKTNASVPPAADPELRAKIIKQIEYYFSNDNLIKDIYLRKKMDENGWVPLTLVAGFKQVEFLTKIYEQVLDAVRYSTVVELQDEKIRKRDDWIRWIIPPSAQFPTASTSNPVANLAARMQNVNVDEKANDQNHPEVQLDVDAAKTLKYSSENTNSPLQTDKDGESSSGH